MKKSVVFGLALIALVILYPFILPSGQTLTLDVAPDFLGFILIYLGLEKLKYRNKILKELSGVAVTLAVVSFITFAAQLAPFYASFFIEDTRFIAIIAVWIGDFYSAFEFLFIAVYMVFIAFFCIGIYSEIKVRVKTAPEMKRFSDKNEYGDVYYSLFAHKLYKVLSVVFAALFFVIAALSVVYHFTELSLYMFNAKMGLWITFLPVSVLFIVYENTAINIIKDERKEPRLSAG